MTPHHRGGAARAALSIIMALAFCLSGPPPAGRAQQPGAEAYAWQGLPDGGPVAGHILLPLPDGRLLALGGESSPGVAGPTPLVLEPARSGSPWAALPQSGDIPRSRLTDRGLLGAAAVIDAAENLVLLTCDCADGRNSYFLDLADGAWRLASQEGGPGALWYPILAYDAARDRAILIGGDRGGTGVLSGEVWSFDLSSARSGWTRLGDAGWTTPLLFSASAIGPDGALWIFSGGDALGDVQEQMWRVDLAHSGERDGWSAIPVAGGPSGRLGASLVFDLERGTGWLYGGYRAVADIPQDQGDIWRLTLGRDTLQASWNRVTNLVGGEPQARSGHAAAWVVAGSRMVIYGGAHSTEGETAYLEDAWALASALMPGTPTPTPTPTPEASVGPRIYLPLGSKP